MNTFTDSSGATFQTTSPASGAANGTAEFYIKPFNDDDVIVTAVLLIFFMVFGIIANMLTIAVIMASQKLRSIFYSLIFSLCLSDTASALISWINLYRRTWGYDHFALPDFICVLYRSVDIWTSFATALHILSFAVLRLVSVTWPMWMKRIKPWHGQVYIASVWLVTFLCGGIPMIMFNGVGSKDRTAVAPDSKWPACTALWVDEFHLFAMIAFPIFFYIPIACVIIISIVIVTVMIRRNKKIKSHISTTSQEARRSREKSTIAQLILIVASFLLGYLPFTAFEFYTYDLHNDSPSARWLDWHFGTWQYICLRFSECLDPIFYHVGSRRMREETKKFCHQRVLWFRRRSKLSMMRMRGKVSAIT